LIPVRHSEGLPFQRSATVNPNRNPNPNADPRNGGPPEWGAGTAEFSLCRSHGVGIIMGIPQERDPW